ncbi:MAG TPA: polysaccharide deacetylase family protein [Gaiellaceae bacterium]|nr:polysaccharide deacetylase family protein [Gaiellaceae bacterium]
MPGGQLALGPRWLYPAKAAATTARSARWLLRRGSGGEGIRILFYHRVSPDRDELGLAPEKFAAQMERLAALGLRAVDVNEAARALDAGITAGLIGLSFDDGYQDVADHALPVLDRLGFTATVFIATGVTGGRAHFTWYEQQPPLMSWDTIRALDGGPLRFEAHTVTHPNLLQLSDEDARREITDSKAELEQQLGRRVDAFCYPAGLFGARERAYVEEAGFANAVSCEPGINTAATDRLALLRRQIDRRDTMLDFRAKVAGAHDTPPALRGIYRRLRYGA